MTPLRRLPVLAAGVVAVVGLSGIAGTGAAGAASSSQSAKQWAGSVCSAFLTFGDSVESTISGLQSASSVEAASTSAKDGINQAVQDLQTSLDDLGKPPTPNAKSAQSAIQSLGNELEQDASTIQSALTPAPSTPVEIASAFATIGSTVQKGVSQAKSTASTLEGLKGNDELKAGFESASSCKQLKSDL